MAVLFLSSCVKDFEFDNLENEKKMVAIATMQPNQPLVLNLTETMNISRDNIAYPLKDAKVLLYEDGLQKDILNYFPVDTAPYLGYYKSNINLKSGSRYTIEASKYGYPSIRATDTIPAIHQIDKVTVLEKPDSANPELSYKIRFQLYDSPQAGEIYYTQVALFYTIKIFDIELGDTVIQNGYFFPPALLRGTSGSYNRLSGISILSDASFNGRIRSVIMQFKGPSLDAPEFLNAGVVIISRNVSKTYDSYQLSLNRYFSDENKIFSQPKAVNNNIVNGYGTFQSTALLTDFVMF